MLAKMPQHVCQLAAAAAGQARLVNTSEGCHDKCLLSFTTKEIETRGCVN